MTLTPGSSLGPYEILEQLGVGGMGIVFRARDTRLQRDVAIKVLPYGALADDTARGRFRREGLALAKLSHANIATVFDVGEQDGVSYIVMERVVGQSLATRLESGPLSARDVVALGLEIAAALEEAHDQGVVHRDLKPANVMLTPKGHAKVLDFGLAKLLAPEASAGSQAMSETRGAVGTLLYMSPEQATGDPVDARTDLWSLGVLLYELATGVPPFTGAGTMGVLHAITQSTPVSITSRVPQAPAGLDRIVSRALAKDPAARYQTAEEMGRDLSMELASLSGPSTIVSKPRGMLASLVPAIVGIAVVAAAATWLFVRSERQNWAREQAPAEITALRDGDRTLAALLTVKKARAYAPTDTTLLSLEKGLTTTVSVSSSPPGATVEIQDYAGGDSSWYSLGTTPIAKATVPDGYLRWRLTTPSTGPMVTAPILASAMHFALDSSKAAPAGMVYANGHEWATYIDFIGIIAPVALPSFYIDRFEVTNLEYQKFVDSGGYDHAEYWRDTFVDGGRTLSRAEAMARFRDSTGRPGPSTWKGGHFPEGQASYPVQGVSWYEASAYAAFAGKALPVVAQWYYAAPPDEARMTIKASNISRDHIAAVGTFRGVGPFGTYDMAGNVREWVVNPVDADRRLILGGGWSSESYLFSDPEALSSFDRSSINGFRCVKSLGVLPDAAMGSLKPFKRDFAKATPASDAVFRAYQAMYAYDKTPLDAKVEGVVRETSDWREERITFNTAYGNERMAAYFFVPKKVRPPYQTVVFFPSARVVDLTNSDSLGDVTFFDYVVQSGRAVLYPIYQNTYERRVRTVWPTASLEMTLTVQRFKDLARSLDYLATRADVDTSKFAYLGVSMGSADGVIYTTLLQDRLKTDVFLDGGFFLQPPSVGRDQVDFAPRLKIPVLMVNGRYDYSFSLDQSQLPLFNMLGTPAKDKRHVVLDTPHDVRAKRSELVPAVLDWLDKCLGPVH